MAGLVVFAAGSIADVLDQPVKVVFRLSDDVRIDGLLTEWNRDGFDGSFGQRYWVELRTDDAWRLFRRLIDEENAEHWIDIGRMALMHGDGGERYAEYAFRRAIQINPDLTERIGEIRASVDAQRQALSEAISERRPDALRTLSPEAGPWSGSTWPELLPARRDAARLALFNEAEAILDVVQLSIEPVESDFFIVYSDSDRRDAAQWAVELDNRYVEMARSLGADETENIFWGKAVVFVLKDPDAFRLIEVHAFRQLLPRFQTSVAHYRGPQVYINAVRSDDDVLLRSALAREAGHAFLHRFKSDRRLPAWAHEGFAEHFAQKVLDESRRTSSLRQTALSVVRSGTPPSRFMAARYDDGVYPGPNHEVRAIGYLLVEFLLKSGEDRFAEWVGSIKAGIDWRDALETTYRGSVGQLLTSFVQYYRVND